MRNVVRAAEAPSAKPHPEPRGEHEDEPPDIAVQPAGCRTAVVDPPRRTLVVISSGKRSPRTNPITSAFKRRFYPGISDKTWNDWHWQIQNRIRSAAQLTAMLDLSSEEQEALGGDGVKLPIGITPYFMSLIQPDGASRALRRTVVPTCHELRKSDGEADDPLGEELQSPVAGLVHRYPDRVLLLVHDFCSTYCRYCTRSRVVGHADLFPSRRRLEDALDYIRGNNSIRDVLLSGGDPLTLSDDRLDWILTRLRQIPHVEIIRIGTKVPVVLPQRITPRLVRMLRRHHPLWMSLHFTHPDECTTEAYRACGMLADAGIPLGSQTVLLKDVNDSVETMRALVHHLMRMRVRPYYLYQCDPITGSAHFRTPIEKGLEIIRGLRGFTTGYAVPTYVVDAPGGGGKIPLMPDYVCGRDKENLILRNYEGRRFAYPDGC
ncbi:MAG: KamA family radical SAM protein [Desulfobacterales bacterium]